MQILLDQKISRSPKVLAQELAGEYIILNLQREEYFSQNEVGNNMFSIITESDSIHTAYETLLKEYDVEPEQLKQDLVKFIEQLINAGLVEIHLTLGQ